MKVWISKYALTQGIFETEVRVCHGVSDDMITETKGEWPAHYHGKGRNWHETKESAIKRAEVMRAAKIASLRKSIAKMEKLRFA